MPLKAAATKPARDGRPKSRWRIPARTFGLFSLVAVVIGLASAVLQARYTFTLQSPLRIRFQRPLVIAQRNSAEEEGAARADQFRRRLTAYQQYACNKFGPVCQIALAVQRAENPRGACEIYHYNSDDTLDWGYFQINTVRPNRADSPKQNPFKTHRDVFPLRRPSSSPAMPCSHHSGAIVIAKGGKRRLPSCGESWLQTEPVRR